LGDLDVVVGNNYGKKMTKDETLLRIVVKTRFLYVKRA